MHIVDTEIPAKLIAVYMVGLFSVSDRDLAKLRDAAALVNKADKEVLEYSKLVKTSIVGAKDKAWYKNLANLTKSMDGKLGVVSKETSLQLTIAKKKVNALVQFTKNYKTWVKRGEDEVFITYLDELQLFLKMAPEIELSLPPCVECDLLSVHFSAGMLTCLQKGEVGSIVGRFTRISNASLGKHCTGDEVSAIQLQCINQVVIDVLNQFPSNSKWADKDRLNLFLCVHTFLSAFPKTSEDISKMPFKLAEGLAEQMVSLKRATQIDKGMSVAEMQATSDHITKLERGFSGEQADSFKILNNFVACPNGVRMLRATKERLSALTTERECTGRLHLHVEEFDKVSWSWLTSRICEHYPELEEPTLGRKSGSGSQAWKCSSILPVRPACPLMTGHRFR